MKEFAKSDELLLITEITFYVQTHKLYLFIVFIDERNRIKKKIVNC